MTKKHSIHPKWGCCSGYHESFEDELLPAEGAEDLRSMSDEELRELVAREAEVPSHDLSREELLCIATRRRHREPHPGKAILL